MMIYIIELQKPGIILFWCRSHSSWYVIHVNSLLSLLKQPQRIV